MDDITGRVLLGFVLSLAIGGVAYRRGSLDRSGVAGAVLVGTLIFGFGGWVWGGTLVAFFVSSSVLSHYQAARKAPLAEQFAKSSRRDLGQALANGGLGALLALVVALTGKSGPAYPALALAFFGAMAAVNADTWATELGVLARSTPRMITTGRPAHAGASGAITLEGTLAALAGAAFIGISAFLLVQGAALLTTGSWLLADWILIPVAATAGLAGALFDSLLGASVQAIYVCPRCAVESERRIHACGQRTQLVRGWAWLNNDEVNFLASMIGAILAAAMSVIVL